MPTLYYVHDPMCSWCWGFSSTLSQLLVALPDKLNVQRVLGGLAKDTDSPMPVEMQSTLQGAWRSIEEKIPGVKFNFDFWTTCQPRRATYAACRAIIAARQQGSRFDKEMTAAIQKAYYKEARNPSELTTLIELAAELGLNTTIFEHDISARKTQQQLENEIELSRELYAESYPSLVLRSTGAAWQIPIHYTDARPMLALINAHVK